MSDGVLAEDKDDHDVFEVVYFWHDELSHLSGSDQDRLHRRVHLTHGRVYTARPRKPDILKFIC